VKRLYVGRLWGIDTPFTITEIVALLITVGLARLVGLATREFERSLENISLGGFAAPGDLESSHQGAKMYREVGRARKHNRPLSLVALRVQEDSVSVSLDRIVFEVQQTMRKHYLASKVSKTLIGELEDHDIVATNTDHLLVLLPEINRDDAPCLVDRLRESVEQHVGVLLEVGVASFPIDSMTFEGLLEKAVSDMKSATRSGVQPSVSWESEKEVVD
jgi:hypothetical protein